MEQTINDLIYNDKYWELKNMYPNLPVIIEYHHRPYKSIEEVLKASGESEDTIVYYASPNDFEWKVESLVEGPASGLIQTWKEACSTGSHLTKEDELLVGDINLVSNIASSILYKAIILHIGLGE